jgi:hypothetical protein
MMLSVRKYTEHEYRYQRNAYDSSAVLCRGRSGGEADHPTLVLEIQKE